MVTGTSSLSSDDPVAVGGYTLRRRLGAGGMGVVYLAEHPDRRGPLALKLLRPEFADDAAFRARFAREVSALRAVQGLHTVRIIDAGAYEERPYLVTDYIDGPALSDVIASGPLPSGQVRQLARSLAVALSDIHAAGVVHRDLKPSNVLMAADGIKVIDFGIAQLADATALTTTGSTIGTIGYMAPEQIRGTPGPATDVFAWGLTVAHAAGGRPPFGTGPVEAVIYRVLNEQPDISGLPAGLDGPVAAALAKQPEARPTAAQLVAMCDGTMPAAVPQAPAPTAAPAYGPTLAPYGPVPQDTRAGRKGLMAGGIVAGLVIAGVAVFVLSRLIGIGPGSGEDRAGGAPSTPATSQSGTGRTSSSPSRSTSPGAAPKAIRYEPFAGPNGPEDGFHLTPGYTVTAHADGTCTSPAKSDWDRSDGYSCTAKVTDQKGTPVRPARKELLDPCFAPASRTGDLLCPDTTEPESDGYDVHHLVAVALDAPPGSPAPSPGPGDFFAVHVANPKLLGGDGLDCFLDETSPEAGGSRFRMNCKGNTTATLPHRAGGVVVRNANGSMTATVRVANGAPFKARVTATYG